MRKSLYLFFSVFLVLVVLSYTKAHAAYESKFDTFAFRPTTDGGDYFSVYGSSTLEAWQFNFGAFFDYSNRPLQFTGSSGAFIGQRQSIIDHMLSLNTYGAVGFTEWFTLGASLPVSYIYYYSDQPFNNPTATADKGPSVGDLLFTAKFRVVDVDQHKIGFAVIPYMTLPTGDTVRFAGNGHVTGGVNLVVDFKPIDRLSFAVNGGYNVRDDVTRTYTFTSGLTTTTDIIRVDDKMTYGAAANFAVTKHFQIVAEVFGSTVVRDFFNEDTTGLETGAGVKVLIPNTKLALNAGGTWGAISGAGTPRYRGFVGVNWASTKEAPPPAPDPRIVENKIVLWGKIFYDTAKATIKPISYPILDDVVDVLVKNPQVTLVEVQGHTDFRGSDEYNMKLSQSRAESAMNYLIEKGISPTRLRAVGYGESRPIATNDTAEGMSQNRRTEFIIIQTSNATEDTVQQAN